MTLKPHTNAIATGHDGSTSFERCMSSVTVAIGQLERLDTAAFDAGQRHRITSAAVRLAACLKEQEQ